MSTNITRTSWHKKDTTHKLKGNLTIPHIKEIEELRCQQLHLQVNNIFQANIHVFFFFLKKNIHVESQTNEAATQILSI